MWETICGTLRIGGTALLLAKYDRNVDGCFEKSAAHNIEKCLGDTALRNIGPL